MGRAREGADVRIAEKGGRGRQADGRRCGRLAHGRRRKQEAMGYIDQAIEAAKQSGSHDLVTALTDTRRAWAS